jgi:hypothetical protein
VAVTAARVATSAAEAVVAVAVTAVVAVVVAVADGANAIKFKANWQGRRPDRTSPSAI